jgi:GNAT superfamily N-acetyltransferase
MLGNELTLGTHAATIASADAAVESGRPATGGRGGVAVTLIRRVGADDWQTFRDIRLAALQTDPEVFGSTFERETAFDEATWRARTQTAAVFLAFDEHPHGDTAVGIVMGRASDEPDDAGAWDLMGMWIAPAARSRGLTPRLISEVVKAAREDGADRIVLWYSGGNDRAAEVYARFGFVLTGDSGTSERDPTIVFHKMELALTPRL